MSRLLNCEFKNKHLGRSRVFFSFVNRARVRAPASVTFIVKEGRKGSCASARARRWLAARACGLPACGLVVGLRADMEELSAVGEQVFDAECILNKRLRKVGVPPPRPPRPPARRLGAFGSSSVTVCLLLCCRESWSSWWSGEDGPPSKCTSPNNEKQRRRLLRSITAKTKHYKNCGSFALMVEKEKWCFPAASATSLTFWGGKSLWSEVFVHLRRSRRDTFLFLRRVLSDSIQTSQADFYLCIKSEKYI